jgi:hypothetical protein
MAVKKMPHPDHENHLCYLENVGYIDSFPEAYKELIRDPGYMCRICGRAAAKKESLCAPERL